MINFSKAVSVILIALITAGIRADGHAMALEPDVPVEEKVVELRIYKKEKAQANESKRRIEKRKKLNNGTCSGAFISRMGHVLTAKHCVDGDAVIEVVTHDSRVYKAIVLGVSSRHDLALIHIARRDTPFFKLAKSVQRGQTIFVLGSPLAISNVLTTGIVARIDGDLTFLDCSVLPGNSGGPVIDANGQLVGIVTNVFIVFFGVTHLSVAQGIDAIAFFLGGL